MGNRVLIGAALALCGGTALADYEEIRELSLDTRGIDTIRVDAGAGSLDIVGVPGASEITVRAKILVPGRSDDRAKEKIESDMVLSLERSSDTAVLKSYFESGGWSFGDSPSIDIEVEVPADLHLDVEDGSGSMDIRGVRGDVRVEDGSGSLTLTDVGGTVDIEDGSGSLKIRGAGGDVTIDDGSGSIDVRDVAGSVTVDDGSGSIDVQNVENDFIVIDDGSGGVDYDNVGGRVDIDT